MPTSFGRFAPTIANNYRVTSVAAPVVTLAELKRHLGIYESDFDDYLNDMVIPAASEMVSNIIGEYVSAATIAAYYPRFNGALQLVHRHVASVTSVQYYDDTHTLQTLMATDYVLDTTVSPNLVRPLTNVETYSDRFENPVIVTYSADVNDNRYDVAAIIQATVMVAADLWYNRQNTTDAGRSVAFVTANRLLQPLKRISV